MREKLKHIRADSYDEAKDLASSSAHHCDYYNCNSEKIAIKDQDEYEYPPINRKHDVCDSCNVQKPAWSEEDNRIYYSLLTDIRTRYDGSSSTLETYYNEQIEWLKSIKERYTWKPSEKQMSVLEQWLKNKRYDGDSRYAYPFIQSLYEQLKNNFEL